MGVAFNSIDGQFGTLKHLIAEHRATIEAIVGKQCPEVATRCEDLQPLQRQVDGYFSLLQGEANSRPEQELIAHEQREYRSIVERIQRIFIAQEPVAVTGRKEDVQKATAMPIAQFKAIWEKHLGPSHERIRTWKQKADGIIAKLRPSLKRLQVDWPPEAIDNTIYFEHLQESMESLLDEMEEMIRSAEEDQRQLLRCFDLLAARRRGEFEQAFRSLSEKNMVTFNQLETVIGARAPGVDMAVTIRDVIGGVRPILEETLRDLASLAVELRRGVTELFAETEVVVAQGYSLKTAKDIAEPMVWRSEFLEAMEEELAKREEEGNRTIWFNDDRLKGDVSSKWKRFTHTKQFKAYDRAEAEFIENLRGIIQKAPHLIKKADLERLQHEQTAVAAKYNQMIATRVTPHAGKAVAKVLTNRFDVICKGVGYKGDVLLWSTDIGRSTDDIDQHEVIDNPEPLTPEEIERILDPFMMRLYRVHAEEYAKLGSKSKSKSGVQAFERIARLGMRELPKKVVSFDQIFALITVPTAVNQGAFDMGQRQRLHEGGTLNDLGNKLDEISLIVCAREYRKFTDVVRKRTWNVRRHLAAQGTVFTPEQEAPTSREGNYALVTKERMMDETNQHLRSYQLQNGATDLLGKLEPDLQDRVVAARDIAAEKIGALFEAQGNQVSHDELLALKTGIIAECDQLRRAIPDIEARNYLDLFEESYRCVLWHIENAMDFGARVLGWDKQHDLMAAVQGAQGRPAMTGPQEREFELADLSNPATSNSLQVTAPTGFEEALAQYPIGTTVIAREIRRAFATLEKELPLVLAFGHVDHAARLTPLLTQYREASLASAESSGGSISSVANFDQIFGRLGWIFDQVQYRFKGVMHGFLTQRFIALRKRLQDETLQRVAQEEMRQALSATNDARINEGQYEAFFIQFAQNVLTDRCRQFLYSCITPAMNVEQIGQVGAAINRAVQTVMVFLTDRIRARCAQTRGPISLAELQQCFADAAQIDVATLGLPAGVGERFRTQVLNFLAQGLSRITTPEGLIGAHGIPSATEDYSSLIQREVSSSQRIKDRETLIPLRQTAREQHAQCLKYVEAIRGGLTELQMEVGEDDAAAQRLHQLAEGLAALRFSLYAPSETQTVAGDDFNQAIAHLEALQTTLATLYGQIQRVEEDVGTQRTAIETIRNLTDTLKGLLHFLYQKP